jgi:cytochrome c5
VSPRRGSGRWLKAGVAVALAAAALSMLALQPHSAPTDPPKRRSVYPAHFPDGPGRTVAERSCLVCHSATLVTQQHKDSTGWEKSVKQMETWGVKLKSADRESLLTYLRSRFGPAEPKQR